MRRPAKRRVLTTQRARTAEYDFGGECHPDLQRLGNTETEKEFLFFLNRLTAETISQGSGGTPSMNITLLSPQTAPTSMLFDHTRNTPPNHKLTAHAADKETLLINCHDTF